MNAMDGSFREKVLPMFPDKCVTHAPGCYMAQAMHIGRLQRAILRWLDNLLRFLQLRADGPRAIHSGSFRRICHTICLLEAGVGGPAARQAWDAANRALLENVLAAVRRDPGVRVLVTVDCRRTHQLAERLRHVDEIELVAYWQL